MIQNRGQRLFPDLKFNCDGLIVSWIIGGLITSNASNMAQIQIWRISSNGNEQAYVLINTSYISSSASLASLKVHRINLDNPLPVKSGDFLGIYQTSDTYSKIQLEIYYQELSGPNNVIPVSEPIEPLERYNLFDLKRSVGGNNYPLVSPEFSKSCQNY